MIKPIITLIRISGSDTYVSRSFDRLDDKAIDIIKGCIAEDNELTFTPEEIEKCYLLDLNKLKENYGDLHNDSGKDFDINHEGTPIWEYNDEVEVFTYVLHESLLSISDSVNVQVTEHDGPEGFAVEPVDQSEVKYGILAECNVHSFTLFETAKAAKDFMDKHNLSPKDYTIQHYTNGTIEDPTVIDSEGNMLYRYENNVKIQEN